MSSDVTAFNRYLDDTTEAQGYDQLSDWFTAKPAARSAFLNAMLAATYPNGQSTAVVPTVDQGKAAVDAAVAAS